MPWDAATLYDAMAIHPEHLAHLGAVLLAELLDDGSGFDLASQPSDTQHAVNQARNALLDAGHLAFKPAVRGPGDRGPKADRGAGDGGHPKNRTAQPFTGGMFPRDLANRNKIFSRK